MTETLKTLFFFICYHPSPGQPTGTVYELRVWGLGVKWGWANKTNFSLFLCFVCEVFLAAWSNVAGSFYGKVRVFRFICWCNVSSLYFLHKLLNETAYLICAWWRDSGSESRRFLCALRWGINWQVRNKWSERNHSEADPALFVKSFLIIL